MKLHFVEVTDGGFWGKFAVGKPSDEEWRTRSELDGGLLFPNRGWSRDHVWVLDLQTGEGACFLPGGVAKADLDRHRIQVCHMFEPFLAWLYTQDLRCLDSLPALVHLTGATGNTRRPGLDSEESLS